MGLQGYFGPSIFGTIGRDGISSLAAVIAVLLPFVYRSLCRSFVVTKIVRLIKSLRGAGIDEENLDQENHTTHSQ